MDGDSVTLHKFLTNQGENIGTLLKNIESANNLSSTTSCHIALNLKTKTALRNMDLCSRTFRKSAACKGVRGHKRKGRGLKRKESEIDTNAIDASNASYEGKSIETGKNQGTDEHDNNSTMATSEYKSSEVVKNNNAEIQQLTQRMKCTDQCDMISVDEINIVNPEVNKETVSEKSELLPVCGKSFVLKSVTDSSAKFTLIGSDLGVGMLTAHKTVESEKEKEGKSRDTVIFPRPNENIATNIAPVSVTPNPSAAINTIKPQSISHKIGATNVSIPLSISNVGVGRQSTSSVNAGLVMLTGGSQVSFMPLNSSNPSAPKTYHQEATIPSTSLLVCNNPGQNNHKAPPAGPEMQTFEPVELSKIGSFQKMKWIHHNTLLVTTTVMEKGKQSEDTSFMTSGNDIVALPFAPQIILPLHGGDWDLMACEEEVKTASQKYPVDGDLNELYLITPLLIKEDFFQKVGTPDKLHKPTISGKVSKEPYEQTTAGSMSFHPGIRNSRDNHNTFREMEDEENSSKVPQNIFFSDPVQEVETDENNLLSDDSRARIYHMIEELEEVRQAFSDKKTVSEKRGYMCYFCKFLSTEQGDIIRHWRHCHMTEKTFLCSSCLLEFHTTGQAYHHILTTHPEKLKFPVLLKCSSIFKNRMELCISTDALPLETPTISEKPSSERLRPGVRERGMLIFECVMCSYTSSKRIKMKAHVRTTHMQGHPYFCEYCQRYFSTSIHTRRHIEYRHPGKKIAIGFQRPLMADDSDQVKSLFRVVRHKLESKEMAAGLWKVVYYPLNSQISEYHCRTCDYKVGCVDQMWYHVRYKHALPAGIRCTNCSYYNRLSHEERMQCWAICRDCNNVIALLTTSILNNFPKRSSAPTYHSKVFTCKGCPYETCERSGMIRHIKYQHLQCRPYTCSYCKYTSVERPKVRLHIRVNHPNMAVHVIKIQNELDRIKHLVRDMYEEYEISPPTDKNSGTAMGSARSGKRPSGSRHISTAKSHDKILKHCKHKSDKPMGKTSRRKEDEYPISKVPSKISSKTKGRNEMINRTSKPTKYKESIQDDQYELKNHNHYLCRLCHYICKDRSCMNRHVKYRHLKARPHRCPYCPFGSVEKTKVTIHVKGAHIGRKCYVQSDDSYLQMLLNETRKYYVRVLRTGKQVDDATGKPLTPEDQVDDSRPAPQMLLVNLHSTVAENVPNDHSPSVDIKEEPKDDGYHQINNVNPADIQVVKQESTYPDFTRLEVPVDFLVKSEPQSEESDDQQDVIDPEQQWWSDSSNSSPPASKKARVGTDTEEEYYNTDCEDDPKLKMKPVVILQDIVHVILSGCGTW